MADDAKNGTGGGGLSLRAGFLEFDFIDGAVRGVRAEGIEVMQQIYAAVRDMNWNTAEAVFSGTRVEDSGRGRRIIFTADCHLREAHFVWRGEVVFGEDSSLSFTMDGEAMTSFLRNRIGFCCLHPLTCAGQECHVRHPGGEITKTAFPTRVSPYQPFLSIAGLRHRAAGGWLEIDFEGDVFETEDQRNWTDASFKTYCTPLSLPFPERIEAGTRVFQRVALRYRPDGTAAMRTARIGGDTLLAGEPVALPRLGLGVARDDPPEEAKTVVDALRPDFIRLDAGFNGDCRVVEERLNRARLLGADIVLGLGVDGESDEEALRGLADALGKHAAVLRGVIFLPPPDRLGDAAWLARLAALVPAGVSVGAGCDTNLAELNRNRPDPSHLDCVVFAANPQVHAFDERSIMENTEGLSSAAAGIGDFIGGKRVFLGPLTFKPERNAVATAPEPVEMGALPKNVDSRQRSIFAAAWLAASIGEMARGGVSQTSLFTAVTGWKGVRERLSGSPEPALFASCPGDYFPVYHVLRRLLPLSGGRISPLRCGPVYEAGGVLADRNGAVEIILYNLSRLPKRVNLPGGALRGAYAVRRLDESTYADACGDALWSGRGGGEADSSGAVDLPAGSVVFLTRKGG